MKGIVLAGGNGTRLSPLTKVVSKQLLPVYDKPMIYYPISTLIGCGITDILIVTRPEDRTKFKKLLGDGGQWGVNFSYACQAAANGIAKAIEIADNVGFIKDEEVALILGDNIFHGDSYPAPGFDARIFAYQVNDPTRYGVVLLEEDGKPRSIYEKPSEFFVDTAQLPLYAVPGLYFYPKDVVDVVRKLRPSGRGEFEITDVNRHYLQFERLSVKVLNPGSAWFDAGTFESLSDASNYVRSIQSRTGGKVGDPLGAAVQKHLLPESMY